MDRRVACASAMALLGLIIGIPNSTTKAENVAQGERVFRACAPCHSLEPNRNMTGPSLAELWNRKAGTLPSFHRYSPALKTSSVTWNDQTLDEWIKDAQHLVPGNTMTFQGLTNNQQRADLLAFLK